MDEKIVTHICSECKGFVDPGMQKVIDRLREGNDLPKLIAAEVLSNSSEHAAEILRICECNDLIPGTTYATIDRAGEFYGMTKQQFYNQLAPRGIVASKVMYDVVTIKPDKLAETLGLVGKFTRKEVKHRCVYSYVPSGKRGAYKFCAGPHTTLVSARVILAVAALKSIGSYRVGNPTVSRVYEALLNSSYGAAAKAVYEEYMKTKREEFRTQIKEANKVGDAMMAAEKPEEKSEAEPAANSMCEQSAQSQSAEPQMFLSFGDLTSIIKAAVKEAMAEANRPIVHKGVVLTQ